MPLFPFTHPTHAIISKIGKEQKWQACRATTGLLKETLINQHLLKF